MLRKIEGSSPDEFPFTNLRLVADLIYFDGSLLSYFKDSGGQHYLYYWCDADDMYNRWLVFRSTQQTLSRFLSKKLSLHDLVLASDPTQMYLVDIDDHLQYAHILKVHLAILPADYLPEVDTYYDASLSVFHDEQAARDLIVLMQQDVQETKTKLRMYEQAATRNPEAFRELFSTP
jgi:hypothetical protein